MKPLPRNRIPAIKPKIRKLDLVAVMILASLSYGCSNGPAEQRHYPEEGTPQATLYVTKCGQCHGAPLPGAHTARVWPSVLDRMQVHIKANNVSPVSREELSIILGYLQQHAKKPTVQQSTPSSQQPSGPN